MTDAQSPFSGSAGESKAPETTKLQPPALQKLPDGKIQIGLILIDPTIREIRFPAATCTPERVLEYAVVTKEGKAYESLLVTDITPTQLNTAFLLLRYRASDELFPLPSADRDAPLRFPNVPAEVKAASRFDIRVEWKDGGQSRSFPINELVQFEPTGKTLSPDPWIYNGSYFSDDHVFVAQAAGDIFSIMKDRNTLANYPKMDGDEEGWHPYPNRAPVPGTKVTVIITPHNPVPNHP